MHFPPAFGNQLSPNDSDIETGGRPRSRTVNDAQHQQLSPSTSPKTFSKSNFIGPPIFVRKVNKERIHNYKSFRILILGIQRVGKTSILERFVNGYYDDEYSPSISETYETGLFLEIDDKLKQFDLEFRDFNGELRQHYAELYKEEILKADGIIIVHTKQEIGSFVSALEMITEIQNFKKPSKNSILVLENKSDIKNHFDNIRGTSRSFELDGVMNSEVSAKINFNINESMAMLVRNIEKAT